MKIKNERKIKMEEVKIFGHKNPDTDTIMSSLILEGLEKRIGRAHV